jgi:hypothetical protein
LSVVVAIAVVILTATWWMRSRGAHRDAIATASSPHAADRARARSDTPITRHVAGRVVLDGHPIAASVLAASEVGPHATASAGADGRFALELPAGIYWLRGHAHGVTGAGTRVDVRSADAGDVVVVVHACTRDLVGLVTDSSGGAPIEGARIDGGMAVTNKAGQFTICDTNEQTEIVVEADGFASAARHLMPGDTNVDFALLPEATASGVVVGPDRAPIANARVDVSPSLRANRDTMRTRNLGGGAVADSSGRFSIHALGAGTYDVMASAPGYVLAAPITANITPTSPELVVAMRPADSIRGVARSRGQPVAGASITWFCDGGEPTTSTTRPDGSFELDDARFGHGMFAIEHYQPVRDISVDAKPVQLELVPATEIRGRVVHDGAPVAGAEVSGAGIPATSDEAGRFIVQTLGPGTFQLLAKSDALGGFSSPKSVTVLAGQSLDDVELEIA